MTSPRAEIYPLAVPRFLNVSATPPSRQSRILPNSNLSRPTNQIKTASHILSAEKDLDMTNSATTNSERAKSIAGSAIAVLFLILGLLAAASAATQSPERDAAAVSTLQSAIGALGGANAVAAIQDCILTGSILNVDGTSNNFNWTMAGSEFRIQIATANGGTNVFVSGHGSPAWILNGSTSPLNSYMARANLPFYLPPYVLFQELSDPIYTLTYVGVVQLNGKNAVQVHISDDSDPVGTLVTPQEWYFDPVSFLPVRVKYRGPSNNSAGDYTTATLDMSQFVPFGGVLVPTTISYSNGVVSEMLTIGAATFNSGVSQSVFDPPLGGQQ
jgi:hypothetical protein